MAPLVCGHSDYANWNLPCGKAIAPDKDSRLQISNISKTLGTILMNMMDALDMIKDLKMKYSTDRIQNTGQVNEIECQRDHVFKNGNINFKDEETKVKSSNVTEIIRADYDSMAAAIMFTEQIRFNEDSTMSNGQMSKDLKGLSNKLATILCDCEWIQAISGHVPSTNLACQNTVAGFCQLWTTEETRIFAEYRVLRDIEKYLKVLIRKYQLI